MILSIEEKTNDYENFEKGMIYMKILKKGGSREKGEEETKSMPHAPVPKWTNIIGNKYMLTYVVVIFNVYIIFYYVPGDYRDRIVVGFTITWVISAYHH